MWINEFELPSVSLAETDGHTPMVQAPLASDWRLRAQVYRTLAGVFIEEPSEALLTALRHPDWMDAMRQAGFVFQADFLQPELPELMVALAVEYTTLFACAGGFPPVESVRLTGRYKQEPLTAVTAAYKRWGYAVGQGRFAVFADHLGVELSFMAELLTRGAAALDAGRTDEARAIDKEVKRFWSLHLGRWVRGYAGLVQRASAHSFYRVMGGFLAGFAAEEIDVLGLHKVEDLDRGLLEVPKSDIQLEFNPDEPVCNACGGEDANTLTPPKPGARVVPLRAVSDLDF